MNVHHLKWTHSRIQLT